MNTGKVIHSHLDRPAHVQALIRHFVDLREGTHGGQREQADKERLFIEAVALLDPHARTVLAEINEMLLLGTGRVSDSGAQRDPGGGLAASWQLAWAEQERAGIPPVTLLAHYGRGFHHPHLRGGSVGEWPLNVFTSADAEAQLPTLRAIVTAEVHNLVFRSDYRIIPAITGG